LASFYGNHNWTANTSLIFSIGLYVLFYSILSHKGTFKASCLSLFICFTCYRYAVWSSMRIGISSF